jgi:Fe-S cluster assembly scaffold protein SufB
MAKPAAGQMEAMKAAMSKCAVCKIMVPKMDELAPMKMEVVKLNDGVAVMHSVTDPAKAATLHAVCKEMNVAGAASMAMTDEQAKAQLCENCQEIRSIVKAGATMSTGDTKMGDIMVFTSKDPAVLAKINAMGEKCALMAAGM